MNLGDYEGATQYLKLCVREKVGKGVLGDESQTKPISWQLTDYERELIKSYFLFSSNAFDNSSSVTLWSTPFVGAKEKADGQYQPSAKNEAGHFIIRLYAP